MSESGEPKVELTDAEKRQLLRERRKAKMTKGNATERLNNILSQGSSVKASGVKSVLDKEEESASEPSPTISSHEDDPEIQDISSIAMQPPPSATPPIGEGTPEDIDAIFNKIFQQQTTSGDGQTNEDPMARLMKMFAEGAPPEQGTNQPSFDQDPNISKYQKELYEYQQYQQKLWRFRFLIIRFICTSFNFFYHFLTIGSFRASSHSYIRGLVSDTPVNMFLMWFLTIEAVILSSYYFISSKTGLFQLKHENNIILKGLSLGSMIFPQLNTITPIVARAFRYHDLVGILFGDLALVVVYFGLLSFTH
ncbi:Golgi to ER traffic protein 2 [Spathaspora sp. JA1]|nr:Golgi to ER traffic protein 2 [Spathaspora sp. JA1]